ncbi:MAG: PEP-CTERM sorting domain-containing protein [Pseudorhodobacter sp.]|nr:PEP-CTERM sorting domain-containing protein [Rhizobacter sp.]
MFWGFTSVGGATISSVRIGSTNLFPPGAQYVTSFAIDNFTFAGGSSVPPTPIPSPIPEPETYALMLMGLVGVAGRAGVRRATQRKV